MIHLNYQFIYFYFLFNSLTRYIFIQIRYVVYDVLQYLLILENDLQYIRRQPIIFTKKFSYITRAMELIIYIYRIAIIIYNKNNTPFKKILVHFFSGNFNNVSKEEMWKKRVRIKS